jgi:hypothetical protein
VACDFSFVAGSVNSQTCVFWRGSSAPSLRARSSVVGAVGPDVAEGIEHFQPAPPLGSPSYKKFQKLMGATDENALYLFAGNTHDQICTLATPLTSGELLGA